MIGIGPDPLAVPHPVDIERALHPERFGVHRAPTAGDRLRIAFWSWVARCGEGFTALARRRRAAAAAKIEHPYYAWLRQRLGDVS